jgi:hypothetical protein
MSARRELHALWTRCDTLRMQIGPPGVALSADARRLLETTSDELASAMRRLGSAGMLTPVQTRDLEGAREALTAAGNGGLAPATAVARYAFALQEVAAGMRIALAPRVAGDNGLATTAAVGGDEDTAAHSTTEAVEALAHATSLASKAGHRLGVFTGSGSGAGQRFTARCAGCGGEVRVQRQAGVWSYSRVAPCSRPTASPAAAARIPES